MAVKDLYQGRLHHATERLFAGDSEDLEICVAHLRSRDLNLNWFYQHQGREKVIY